MIALARRLQDVLDAAPAVERLATAKGLLREHGD